MLRLLRWCSRASRLPTGERRGVLRPRELLLFEIHSGDAPCSTDHRCPKGRTAVALRERVSVLRRS